MFKKRLNTFAAEKRKQFTLDAPEQSLEGKNQLSDGMLDRRNPRMASERSSGT